MAYVGSVTPTTGRNRGHGSPENELHPLTFPFGMFPVPRLGHVDHQSPTRQTFVVRREPVSLAAGGWHAAVPADMAASTMVAWRAATPVMKDGSHDRRADRAL